MAQSPAGPVVAASVEHENGAYLFDAASGTLVDSSRPEIPGSQQQSGGGLRRGGEGWFDRLQRSRRWDGKGTLTTGDDAWVHYVVQPSDQWPRSP